MHWSYVYYISYEFEAACTAQLKLDKISVLDHSLYFWHAFDRDIEYVH